MASAEISNFKAIFLPQSVTCVLYSVQNSLYNCLSEIHLMTSVNITADSC